MKTAHWFFGSVIMHNAIMHCFFLLDATYDNM